MLKPEDDTIDQFEYEHSYNVDETEGPNQVFYINIMKYEIITHTNTHIHTLIPEDYFNGIINCLSTFNYF